MSSDDAPSAVPIFAWDASGEDREALRGWRERLDRVPRLYRYVSLRDERFEWFSGIVTKSLIYFPNFADMNDPFDGTIRPHVDGTPEEKREYWQRYLAEEGQDVDAAREQIEHLVESQDDRAVLAAHDRELGQLGVLSLTEIPDDLPMWAYYADAHRGVCLRFNTQRLFNPEWAGCIPPMPATYEDIYPSVSFYRDTRFRRAHMCLATKAKVWSHEKEWRVVRSLGWGLATLNQGALDGVILGCKISEGDEARVRQVAVGRSLELLRASIPTGRFGLDIGQA